MRTALPRRFGPLAALLLVLAPSAQATFGSQVQFGDNDLVPAYDALVAPDDPERYLYVEHGEPGVGGDAVYLDVDRDGSGVVEADDVRLTPVGNRSAGTLVAPGDDDVGAAAVSPAAVGLLYGDRDGNGRYTAGDAVYLVGAPGADRLRATTGAAAWSLRLTPSGGPAGSLVVDGASDLAATVLPFEVDRDLDGGTPAAPEASFGLLNADRGLEPGLRALTPGDHLYLELDATADATRPGDPVSLHGVRLAGGNGTFGTQVLLGHYDFVPRLDSMTLQAVRYEGAGPNATDDVLVVDVDGDGAGGIEVGDVVLSSSGLGNRSVGERVREGDVLLLGHGTHLRGTEMDILYADADGNGHQSAGDYVYLVGEDDGFPPNTDLGATLPGEEAYFALRLTATSGGAVGTLVMEGDQDLTDHGAEGGVAGDARDRFAFFDADVDGAFGPGERAYLNPRGDFPALGALRLHGGPGAFGAPVVFGDDDHGPDLIVDNTIRIVRYNAGDAASFEDDVIVLDADGDGGKIEVNDLVLSHGTATRGTFVTSGSGLVGKGDADGTVGLVYVDVDEDGRYGPGDWAYLREKYPAGALAATVVGENGVFTLRLTDTVGGDAGTFVKQDDEDLELWNNSSRTLHALTDVGIMDADGDHRVSPGDRVYFTEGRGWVRPDALRIVGDFLARDPPSVPPGSGGDGGDGGEGGDPSQDPTDPGGDGAGGGSPEEPAQGEDGKAPGPAAVAVLLAVGLAAWRRRR